MWRIPLIAAFVLTCACLRAQNGLQKIIVEQYYVSNTADSIAASNDMSSQGYQTGTLPSGSITYRIYADLLPGYTLQDLYGINNAGDTHALMFSTSTVFYNSSTGNYLVKWKANKTLNNVLALDSWFSLGAACTNEFGILKADEPAGTSLVASVSGNPNGVLLNKSLVAGIPLTTSDGYSPGTPSAAQSIGITTNDPAANDASIFTNGEYVGSLFTTSDGSIYVFGGVTGPDTNKVLIAQMTTNGKFCFQLNLQLGTPGGGSQDFVATNPVGSELSIPSLTYCNCPMGTCSANTNSAPTAVCSGSPVSYTASGGSSYIWMNEAGTTLATTAALNLNPTASATYKVQVTNSIGCTAMDSVQVTVNPIPVPTANSLSAPTTFCAGSSQTYTAGGGASYLWTNKAGTTLSSSAALTVNPSSSATYYVQVTGSNECSAIDSIPLTTNPLPVGNPNSTSSPAVLCQGAGAIYTATGGSSYLWKNSTGTSLSSVAAVSLTPSSSSNYNVQITGSNGCSVTDTLKLTVAPLPTGNPNSLSGPTTVCSGSNLSFTASGGTSYLWKNDAGTTLSTTATLSANPTAAITYKVQVTNSSGCSITDSVQVTTNAIPVVNPNSTSASISFCAGAGATYTATGGTFYSWKNKTGTLLSSTATLTVKPVSSATYSIYVTNIEGCAATDSLKVTVNPLPVPNPNSTGIPTLICNGNSTTLVASGGSAYLWTSESGTSLSSVAQLTVNPASTTTYQLLVTGSDGCTSTDSVKLIINPLGNTQANSTNAVTTICSGSTITYTASGGSNYIWINNLGDTLSKTAALKLSPTTPSTSTYKVKVSNAGGCFNWDTVSVTVNPSPTAVANSTLAPTSACTGSNLMFTATGGNYYIWKNASSVILSTNATFTVQMLSSATYKVQVTNTLGCSAFDSIVTTALPLPIIDNNIFSSPTQICFGSQTNFVANGGASYLWTNTSGDTLSNTPALNTSPDTKATYRLKVTGSDGCISHDSISITVVSSPTATLEKQTNLKCNGETNGSIFMSVSGGTPPFTYSWNTGAKTTAITNLDAGTYTFLMTDKNSCSVSDTFKIIQPAELNVSMGTKQNEAWVTATGGISPYKYLWTPGNLTTDTIKKLTKGGNYEVVVTDANNCTTDGFVAVSLNGIAFVNSPVAGNILTSPNPVSGLLTLSCTLTVERCRLSLCNAIGQEIYSENIESASGMLTRIIDLSARPSGLYFLSLTSDQGRWTGKIIRD